jgi:hypothetical protein
VSSEDCDDDGRKSLTSDVEKQLRYPAVASKTVRLIEWNTDVLLRLLKQVAAGRHESGDKVPQSQMALANERSNDETVLDEVKEIIELPTFNANAAPIQNSIPTHLSPEVEEQLHDYVRLCLDVPR